jgi:hypothetical protein
MTEETDFALDMYGYQKRSLTWMLNVENSGELSKVTTLENTPLARVEHFEGLLDLSTFKPVESIKSNAASETAYTCKGGILADNPGKKVLC